jgi:tetratricopeptide (TPR) repeat protein
MADSRFCRACGAEVASTDRATTDEDLKMVHDAQRLFSEGRYDEASMVATAILDANPYCVNALAIKGDCHERLGEYAQALACYRDILKVEPESHLDKIRVARLEKIVSSGDIEIGRPDARRRSALGAAVAAAVLLVSSGSALILAAQNNTEGAGAQTIDSDGASSAPFYTVPLVPGNSNYAPRYQDAPENRAYEGLPTYDNNGRRVSPLVEPGTAQGIAPGAIPDVPRGGASGDEGTVEPLRLSIPPGALGSGAASNDPDPTVVGARNNDEDRNMIVDVRPSQGSTTATTNTQVEDRAYRIDALIRVAREQQVLGDFAKAADAYEKALALGASPASTNQRLAQCYEKLGRKADAIKAYERAISAFEKLDQNDERVVSQLEACRAALKLLRGN